MKFLHIIILFILFTIVIFLRPQDSLADIINLSNTTDIANDLNSLDTYICEAERIDGERLKFTQQLVKCFQGPLRLALVKSGGALNIIVNYMMFSMGAIFAVALIIFAIRMLGSDSNLKGRAFSMVLRLGIILTVYSGITGYSNDLFNIFDELIALVSPAGFSPWVQIDKFVGELLGFRKYACTTSSGIGSYVCAETSGIKEGIVGLLTGSIFSQSLGIIISLLGFIAILNIFSFIIQSVYLYLSSIVALAFLMLILPIILPFIFFDFSKQYFQKWFNILISTMITPMLLFAFLSMFIGHPEITRWVAPVSPSITPTLVRVPEDPGIFMTIINKIFVAIGPNYMERAFRKDQPLVRTALVSQDINYHDDISCNYNLTNMTCGDAYKNTSSTQSFVTPWQFAYLNSAPITTNKINFGEDDPIIKKRVTEQLLILVLYIILMNAVISRIPEIAANIAHGRSIGVENFMGVITKVIGSVKNL
jgi:hypothetical protein